ncbi:hypothetical protein ACFV2Q_19815 [Streptomyces sp. NPDC059650]|uniref:hypothetical protein n=1 Tax=Streptomyces sp. NPDC059650 TaxID=3346896 RepID=UPI0036CAF8A8
MKTGTDLGGHFLGAGLDVWSGAEYPHQNLDESLWRMLFEAAGYTVDGKAAERPTEPLTLWRGSVPGRRRDWSWTSDRTIAEEFAFKGVRGRPIGVVWETKVPPRSLLSFDNGREESEYVVDTHGLRIVQAAVQVAGPVCCACRREADSATVLLAHLTCICP